MDESEHILIGQLKDSIHDIDSEEARTGGSRELSLARTNAQQALMWAEVHVNNQKEIHGE